MASTYNPQIHHRRSIRLKGYDYSQAGMYFITPCVQNRWCLFGKITNDDMIKNDAGLIIENWWIELKNKFPNIELDEFKIMPNHIHGIIIINDSVPVSVPVSVWGATIGDMIQWFKTMSTNEYIRNVKQNGWQPFEKKLWQRNYYDHIIRNDQSYQRIAEYIRNNPKNWNKDKFYNRKSLIN